METFIRIAFIIAGSWFVQAFGMVLLAPIIKRSVRTHHQKSSQMENSKRESTVVSISHSLLKFAVYTIAALTIISELGLDIGPLVAGASVVGLALGFGAQSLVKDLVSGLFIIAENQYRVGDLVKLNSVEGRVEQITIRITILRDFDGNLHYVPNGTIELATNKSMDYSGINMILGVSYDSDIDLVEKVVNEVAAKMASEPKWSEQIVETPKFKRITSFGDSAINIRIIGKVLPSRQFEVAGELRRRLKTAFDKNKIVIPFPQRTIHTKK